MVVAVKVFGLMIIFFYLSMAMGVLFAHVEMEHGEKGMKIMISVLVVLMILVLFWTI